jgi:opacity protein-like surface antigen/outer membrane protein OmpA-like peptidoglycan-associated protein
MASKIKMRMIAVTVLLGPALMLRAQATNSAAATGTDASSDSHTVSVAGVEPAPAAQSTGGAPASPGAARYTQNKTPKVELFLGYSYFRGLPTYAAGNRMVELNGGTASVAFNLNRYLGLVGDFAGFRDTQLNLTGLGANPPRVADSSGSVFTYLFGPRLSYRKWERVTPFAQALFGGVHASQVKLSGCTGTLCTPLPTQNAFAFTAGGGLDIKVQRHLAIRVVQAEYMMTRFADVTTGASNSQNDLRLSAGLVLRFGGEAPALPVSLSCVASPASVYPGDPISVSGSALNLNPKRTTTYSWTTDGGRVSGSTETVNIDLKDVSPGSYTAKGHVSQGNKPDRFADCSAAYTVMAFQPPTVSCSAAPSTVHPGEPATITAQGVSPQSRPLSYSYSASEGSIDGTTSSATLNTGAASGTINVTCNVVDDKGQTASSTTTVSVQAPAPPPAPTTQALCSIHFDRDARRPTRVDNEAKACLDDVALNLQRSSDAKVAIEGNSDAAEKASHRRSDAATQRALNTKDYLVTEKGIDSSRITVDTGSSDGRTVDMILIPSGASLDRTGLTPVDESATAVHRKNHHDR